MVKSMGPRTEPCGTPYLRLAASEVLPPIVTDCDLLRRYESIQRRARSDTPHTLLQAFQQDVMVKGVEGRREVQENQEHSAALVNRPQKFVLYLDQGCLCAVVAAIGRLVLLIQAMLPYVTGQLGSHHLFQDLGDKR